jgi:hypothetical protein
VICDEHGIDATAAFLPLLATVSVGAHPHPPNPAPPNPQPKSPSSRSTPSTMMPEMLVLFTKSLYFSSGRQDQREQAPLQEEQVRSKRPSLETALFPSH